VLLLRRAEREGDPWSGHMALRWARHLEDADLLHTARARRSKKWGSISKALSCSGSWMM